MPVLATKDLTYYYFSDRNIFEGLDLEFERGKVYVILGASGSGFPCWAGWIHRRAARSCSKEKTSRRWGWNSIATTVFRSCSRTIT